MNPSSYPRSIAIALLSGSIALISGCGGMATLPDSVTSPEVQGPAIQGNMYGGHAPIVGSHVYVLQPGVGGYGSPAKSLLGLGGQTSASGYAITANVSDPNVPAGAKYVTTDSNGSWNITGGYSCTAGQPVFLYSYGGASPVSQPPTTDKNTTRTVTADITKIVETNAQADTQNGTATYAVTVSSSELLTAGSTVTIAGLTGNLSILNGTQTVLTTPAPGTNTFSFVATDVYDVQSIFGFTLYYDYAPNGTYTATTGPAGVSLVLFGGQTNPGTGPFGSAGTATGSVTVETATTNPITEMATLGVCPTSGNFSSGTTALKFVFMNEISTIATAYTFQPYTSPTNNTAWDIGSSGTTAAIAGTNIAAQTAAQLYDIQGSVQDTNSDGEGHIANTKTQSSTGTPNGGTGVVPQAEIDTLGNILAACIDSTPGTGGILSTQCSTLFNTATDNGNTVASGDTAPTDTATAAINIARYPAGNAGGFPDATYVSDLYGIPSTTVPFSPALNAVPNDWTIALQFSGGGLAATSGQAPLAVAVDGSGNIYSLGVSTNKLSIFSPLGIPLSTTGFGAHLNVPDSVAIDPTSSFVWLANYGTNTVSRFTTSGTGEVEFPLANTGLQDAQIDGSGNVWVTIGTTNNGGNGSLVELNSAGAVQQTLTTNVRNPYGLAVDPGPNGAIWIADETVNDASKCSAAITAKGNNCTAYNVGGINQPTGAAIDVSGNAWFTNANGTVTALTNGGAAVAGSPFTTNSTSTAATDGIAIDGNGNVWATNSNSFTVYKLTNAGAQVSPAKGYLATPQTEPDGIAIDGSGNVWYDSFNAGTLYELVGAGIPVVTPLSYAAQQTKLGTKP